MKDKIQVSAPAMQIIPKEHFHVKGIKKAFDLSGLIHIYAYVLKHLNEIKIGKDYEMDIGRSTIVFSFDGQDIHLITGWVGNREKK